MDIVEAIAKVLVVGLIFGAGLPALFAVGLRVHEQGSDEVIDGSLVKGNPAMRVLSYAIFVVVALVILTAAALVTSWPSRQRPSDRVAHGA